MVGFYLVGPQAYRETINAAIVIPSERLKNPDIEITPSLCTAPIRSKKTTVYYMKVSANGLIQIAGLDDNTDTKRRLLQFLVPCGASSRIELQPAQAVEFKQIVDIYGIKLFCTQNCEFIDNAPRMMSGIQNNEIQGVTAW